MNPHAKRARTRKVRALCRAAREVGRRLAPVEGAHIPGLALAHWLERAHEEEWNKLADMAGTHSPSRFTRARVVTALRRYDRERRAL